MNKRDSYKDVEYFEKQLASHYQSVARSRDKLSDPNIKEQARQNRLNILFTEQYEKALTLYNMGKPISEVVETFNSAWPLLIEQLGFSLQSSLDHEARRGLSAGSKIKILPLMVLCETFTDIAHPLLEFTNTELNRESLGADVAFTPLTYEFAKYLGYQSDRVSKDLLWPEIYEGLYKCFDAPTSERPTLLKAYVDNWVKIATKEDIYLKDEHKLATNQEFRGYWCFLAAAVAKILDIPDEDLKDHPHYPYDLRHYKP